MSRAPLDDRYTLTEIGDACIEAEIPDGKYQSLVLALKRLNRPHPAPNSIRGEKFHQRHIEIFRVLMATESTTLAAGVLLTSQPTISRELRQLEEVLGFQLFDRDPVGRCLRPTGKAYALLEAVERHYVGLDAVRTAAADIRDQP